MQTIANFIGGKMVAPAGGGYLDVVEPATGAVMARVPDSDAGDVDAAVGAAAGAFAGWSGASASERSRVLLKLADLIDANLERLAEAESRDTGKPIALARAVDIPRSAANFRHFATAVLHMGGAGEMHEFDGGGVPAAQGGVRALNYTLRRARGVAGLISPWNLPLYLLTWKIAPALATGNTVVAKPSEVAPLTAYLLGELANEVGIPPGVLNIVHGLGPKVGGALVMHADVPTISFTGSTGVGKWIGREAGERLKRVSLELGGKNPFVVFDDANFDEAVNAAVRAGFTNQGQICLCGSRLIVQEGIYGKFMEAFVARVKALKIGDPMEEGTEFGALTSAAHLAKVEGYVEMARLMGGRVLCGGSRVGGDQGGTGSSLPVGGSGVVTGSELPVPPKHEELPLPPRVAKGFFYEPTVIEGLDPTCRVEQEEIFGPVVTVQKFAADEDALRLANGTGYGLAAIVYTESLRRANTFAAGVQSGIVWVNCWMVRDLRTPFGGMKQSGVGREGGLEAIRFFTEPKNVCVRV